MKNILRYVSPFYVFHIEVHRSAVGERFRITSAEHNIVVDFFAGHNKIIRKRFVDLINGSFNVFPAENLYSFSP